MGSGQGTRAWKGGVAGAIAVLALGSAGGFATVYSGAVNVAATEAHGTFTERMLSTAMRRSVRARAASVGEPMPVDSALLVHGFEHYDAMCVACHGAPGVEPGEYGQGLNPHPPELAEEAHEWSDRELFWITKYGVRMTGMPAFGPTHSDEEIWAIVAAMRALEEMTPEQYAAMVAAAGSGHSHGGTGGHSHGEDASHAHDDGAQEEAAGHSHAPGTPPHEH